MKGKDKVMAIVTIIVIIVAIAVIFWYVDINMGKYSIPEIREKCQNNFVYILRRAYKNSRGYSKG